MRAPAYAAFSALDPFFDIVKRGLAGLVDGDHYFDTIAADAVFEFRYRFPGWPTKLVGREAGSGKLYKNRFISVVTIEDRKIVGWRDYMDSLAAMSSLT